MIRKRLWIAGDLDPNDDLLEMSHLDHCLDMIRQNIMCSSDITPITYAWSKKEQRAVAVGKVMRTCRDFEAIKQWGIGHQVSSFDPFIKVEDPLGNVEI